MTAAEEEEEEERKKRTRRRKWKMKIERGSRRCRL